MVAHTSLTSNCSGEKEMIKLMISFQNSDNLFVLLGHHGSFELQCSKTAY